MYNYYITLLGYPNIPEFLNKYLTLSSLNRLKEVGILLWNGLCIF